ncbi:hypothetical protein [Actinomadura sp. 7K507]|uniref:hypothetical protein n=1 Tax=Actinomadura sp. 7K507 TaxID=2530365 RepID=UPI001048D1A5|nr:hypothetical protein [Actinomadura sp. 7K507]TDC96157.1 hypothetical protein E1285_06125 [Actinomadura sp. 7K507]
MSSGARHGIGALIGVVVTPIIAACLMYGTYRLGRSVTTLRFEGADRWLGAAALLAAAVLIGLVAGSRISPLASLIPGAVYSLSGALWVVSPRWSFQNTASELPSELSRGYMVIGPYGVFLVIGVALLLASLAPSRWRSLRGAGAAPRFGGPPPAPMGPPPMHGAQQPMGAHQPPQAPPGPGQSPPWQGAPQYGQPPAQPGAANPPPLPSGPPAAPAAPAAPAPAQPADDRPESSPRRGPDEDNPGEWTQMYGGNRPQ